MSMACASTTQNLGNGVAAALQAVDCTAGEMSAAAFGRLFAPGGALVPVLTILLTLYVAFFAISLLLGRSSLGVRQLTPRMITVGLVLTFATSWVAYQGVVWNLAVGTPDYLATLMTGSDGSATTVFAQKLDVVFMAVQQASEGQQDIGAFSPPGMMWLGAMLLLLGTVGVLVTARIALALLVALGPIFVVMALFPATRGLFAGWIKGMVMLAATPLFAVLGGSIMLELAVPVLGALTQVPGQIDAQAAMAFFVIGAVHMALMVMILKVTGTMVTGWNVFGLAGGREVDNTAAAAASTAYAMAQPQAPAAAPDRAAGTAAAAASSANARRIELAGVPVAAPANDASGGGGRETRIVTASGGVQAAQLKAAPSRTHGIGTRFRASAPRALQTKPESSA